MRNKILCILILVLFSTTGFLPASGMYTNDIEATSKSNPLLEIDTREKPLGDTFFLDHPPRHLSRFLHHDVLEFQKDTLTLSDKVHPEITKPCYKEDIVELIQRLDVTMFLGYLENLTASKHRVTGTHTCDEAARYLYNEFKNMGLEVRYQNWTLEGSLYGSNIEATIRGVDPSSDEIYIVCAHYDTVHASPGADDNGAGTVAVLSIANVMSQYTFNHTVRFVTFSGEEQGLYGSFYYVQESYENDDNIVAALNADMIGYALTREDNTKVKVYDEELSEWITDFTISISQEYSEYLNLQIIPSGISGASDHARFWAAGYHSIFYHEYKFNPWYHTPGDVIANMNPSYATNVTKLILATLAELAQPVILKPPDEPAKPAGETRGKVGEIYNYTTYATDPNGDQLYYLWDWGDGTRSRWLGPYHSGEKIMASHIWNKEGEYEIKVKARDTYNLESDWSEPLTVSMPMTKHGSVFQRFLEKHIEHFPLLERLLSFF